jgi:predicted ferric reductase
MEVEVPGPWSWKVGQHYYITFLDGRSGIWQSHPFTPLSLHAPTKGPTSSLAVFAFRGKTGETRRIAKSEKRSMGVILTGPYGVDIMERLRGNEGNVLCIAGGTGITFVLPVILALSEEAVEEGKMIKLVWVTRYEDDVKWVEPELQRVRANPKVQIKIIFTRPSSSPSPVLSNDRPLSTPSTDQDIEKDLHISTPSSIHSHGHGRPDVTELIQSFVSNTQDGPTWVISSGPTGMLNEIRRSVAGLNDVRGVWNGDSRGDIRLIVDDRME